MAHVLADHLAGGLGGLDLLGEVQGPAVLAREHLDRVGEAEAHVAALVGEVPDVAGHRPEELVLADLGRDPGHRVDLEVRDLGLAVSAGT